MSYLSTSVHNRLPCFSSPTANMKNDTERCKTYTELSSLITKYIIDQNNNSRHSGDTTDTSNTISENASKLSDFVAVHFPYQDPQFLNLQVTNDHVDKLFDWMFSSSSSSSCSSTTNETKTKTENTNIYRPSPQSILSSFISCSHDDKRSHQGFLPQSFKSSTCCNEYLVPARLLSLALHLCTELEVQVRNVPGFEESEEGIGLLNQVVKARLFSSTSSSSSSSKSDQERKSSQNEKIDVLIFLLRHVLVEGKGMHLRNLLWHGYLMPTTNENGKNETETINVSGATSSSSSTTYKRETCSSTTLLMCTFLLGLTYRLLRECFPSTTAKIDDKNQTNDEKTEKEKSSRDTSLVHQHHHPPDWNPKLFQSTATMYVFQGIPDYLTSSSFHHKDVLSRFQIYFDFIAQHGGIAPQQREFIFPLSCVVFESMLRGITAAEMKMKMNNESSSSSCPCWWWYLIDAADERYYLVDFEDLLSWQGVYSLQNISDQNGILRRGIQRLRDISADVEAKRKKQPPAAAAVAAMNDDDDHADIEKCKNNTDSNDINDLPLNVLLSSKLIPTRLFQAMRGCFMTLLPVGPRVRDLFAHGKLSTRAIVKDCYLDHHVKGLIQETIKCCLEKSKLSLNTESYANGGFYNYPEIKPGSITAYIVFHFREFEHVFLEELWQPIFSNGEQAKISQQIQPNEISSSLFTLSLKHGINRKLKSTCTLFDDEQFIPPASIPFQKDERFNFFFSKIQTKLLPLLKSAEIVDITNDLFQILPPEQVMYTSMSSHVAKWVATEIEGEEISKYAIRSSLAFGINVGRLCKAMSVLVQESLKKWPVIKTKTTTKKNDDNEVDDEKNQTNKENLKVVYLLCALVRLFLCAGPSKYFNVKDKKNDDEENNDDTTIKAKKNNNTAKNGSGGGGRCLLDLSIPLEERMSKSFARNLSVIESCSTDNFSLQLFGKLFVACLDW